MSKYEDILIHAEQLFDQQGFHSTSIDQIVLAAQVTPRTLYRHFFSKEHLVLAVLEQREIRFLKRLEQCIDKQKPSLPVWLIIFSELEKWFSEESEKGCLFLRALAEYRHKETEINQRVFTHKQRTLDFLSLHLAKHPSQQVKNQAESLMLIIEGAVALAPVIGGKAAVQNARFIAQHLFNDLSHSLPQGEIHGTA